MHNSILDYVCEYKKGLRDTHTNWTYNYAMDMGENRVSVRCIVSGKVQGVFFRASTREQALRLNIKGHAKNLMDGNVEVIANGNKEDIQQLKQWLQNGPQHAVVEHVECETLSNQQIQTLELNNFKIL